MKFVTSNVIGKKMELEKWDDTIILHKIEVEISLGMRQPRLPIRACMCIAIFMVVAK